MSPRQAARCCEPVDDLLDPAFFKALCDPTRVLIMACLIKCGRDCAVGEIAQCCDVDLSVVSRHLRALESAGLLRSTRRGRGVTYAVEYASLCATLRGLADAVERCCPAEQLAAVRSASAEACYAAR